MSRMTCRGGVRGESGAIVSDLHDVDIYSLATSVYITARDPRSESSAAHHVINQSSLSSCDKSMIPPCFLSCHAPRENNSIKTAIECKQGTPAYAGDIGDCKKETIKTIQMDRVMLMIHH